MVHAMPAGLSPVYQLDDADGVGLLDPCVWEAVS